MMTPPRLLRIPSLALGMTAVAALLMVVAPGLASADTDCATTAEWLAVNPTAQAGDRIVNSSSVTVTLHDCTISGRSATSDVGGGVKNTGSMELTRVVISGNSADLGGGGIYNEGSLTLTDVVITGNSTGSNGVGGGIWNNGGTVVMQNVSVTGNTAGTAGSGTAGGGGIANDGSMNGAMVTVANNTTYTGDGGGILNRNNLCLGSGLDYTDCATDLSGGNSLVRGNHASTGNGGGIANPGNEVILTDSTVDQNGADGGDGGGLWNYGRTLDMYRSTISNNSASGNGGGIANDSGSAAGYNLTVAANLATNNGGGVSTTFGFTFLASCTIANNNAAQGGGVYSDDSSITEVGNTLIANADNCSIALLSDDGYNLETDNVCGFSDPSDKSDVSEPGLGQLGPNGGPLQGSSNSGLPGVPVQMKTIPLKTTSPALNNGAPGAACLATDERGTSRPQIGFAGQANNCDIGAFELTPCLTVDKSCALVGANPSPFTCKAPITTLNLKWMPGSSQVIDLKAWNGKVGDKAATVVKTQCGIQPGQVVEVSGLGKNPDAYFQIYDSSKGSCDFLAGNLIGQSKFHVGACDDNDMNGAEDCGKFEGNGKDNKADLINDWTLQGMTGSNATNGTLSCNYGPGQFQSVGCVVPIGGADVVYKYKVTNIGDNSFPGTVTGTLVDVDVTNNVQVASQTFTVAPGAGNFVELQSDPVTITQNTTNVATATSRNGVCEASDQVTVNEACAIYYPYSNSTNSKTSLAFNESGVLRTFQPDFTGSPDDTIRVFYNDEHALTLGIRQVVVKPKTGSTTTTSYTVSPLTTNPGNVSLPSVGAPSTDPADDQAGLDTSNRPIFPALFITDITDNQEICSPTYPDNATDCHDWQWGGTPIPPSFVAGTWKAAVKTVDKTKTPAVTTVTPDADPAKNNWNLGTTVAPPGFPNQPPAGLTNEGYGAEVAWSVSALGLQPGRSYRLQFMVHDGDQNKSGGDVGQNCSTVGIPAPPQ
jgi:hypothetical protein